MVIRYADWYRWPVEHDPHPEKYGRGAAEEDRWGWVTDDYSEPTRRADPGLDYKESWWWIPGPHTGHGPGGYSRADSRIVEEVCDRLTQHGLIDARDIEVEAEGGEVTLNGTVPDRHTKRLAEDVAESVSGVRGVHNRLLTRPRTPQPP